LPASRYRRRSDHEPDVRLRRRRIVAGPEKRSSSVVTARSMRALGVNAAGDAVRSTRGHVQSKTTDRGREYARHWHGDNSAGDSPTARGVTPNVQRVCEESTKYPEMGMLHDLV
jgi:hypothetical protein